RPRAETAERAANARAGQSGSGACPPEARPHAGRADSRAAGPCPWPRVPRVLRAPFTGLVRRACHATGRRRPEVDEADDVHSIPPGVCDVTGLWMNELASSGAGSRWSSVLTWALGGLLGGLVGGFLVVGLTLVLKAGMDLVSRQATWVLILVPL